MKFLLAGLIFLLFSDFSQAQSFCNVILRTENGEKFKLYLNSVQITETAVTQVTVENLKAEFYQVKIDFEAEDLRDFTKPMYLEFGSELVYTIMENSNGKYVLRMTQSTSLTGTESHHLPPSKKYAEFKSPSPEILTAEKKMNLRPEELGCYSPFSEKAYEEVKNSIKNMSFADAKLTRAKQISSKDCLTALQVKGIMQLFDFEDMRLDFAKFAYNRTYDRSNYFVVNDAFDFEFSIEELHLYIQSQQK